MRKILLYVFLIVLCAFLIPILFTIQFATADINVANLATKDTEPPILPSPLEETTPEIEQYNYKEYGIIKLLHEKTGQIEEIEMDKYLYGVVSSEMPASFEIEALKAQAIVARTYTVYKIKNNSKKHGDADICDNSSCCQAWISKEDRMEKWSEETKEEYWNKIVNAVDSTKGQIITYDGEPINAFFHSNSGGNTEVPLNVWGGSGYPYLQVVTTAGEDAYSQYNSEVELTKSEVIEKIKAKHNELEIDFSKEDAIQILEYTESGRIKTIKFGNVNLSGVEARTIFGLRSANFTVQQIDGEKIKFTVIGYGHGVGMSQTGADALAKQGSNYEDIIKHFYVGVEIVNI